MRVGYSMYVAWCVTVDVDAGAGADADVDVDADVDLNVCIDSMPPFISTS